MEAADQSISASIPGGHACLAYPDAEERTRVVAAFLRGGLERDERCAYAAPPAAIEAVLARLTRDGLAVDRLRAGGALVIQGLREAYLPHGSFDPRRQLDTLALQARQARSAGFAGFRGVGEASYPLETALPGPALLQYEAGISDVMRSERASGLCVYDRRLTAEAQLFALLARHPQAVLGGQLCDNPLCPPGTGDHAAIEWVMAALLHRREARPLDDVRRALVARDRLLGTVARQLGKPLTALRERLDALASDARITAARDEVELCSEQLERVTQVSDRLAEIAATLETDAPLRPASTDLAALTAAAVAVAQARLGRPGQVRLVGAEALPGQWDQTLLGETLARLTMVAIDQAWGTPITIRMERLGNAARITIACESPEVTPDGAGAVDRRERLDLALWTTREWLRRMRGTLGISTWPDGRVTLTAEIPRAGGQSDTTGTTVH